MTSELRGSRVLITGASSGVGRAAVDAYAQAGADIALLARGEAGLEVAAAAARKHGARVVVTAADVTDRSAVEAAMQRAIDELGGLDVVVSCAAAVVFGDFRDVEPEDFDRTVAVTFLGAVNVIRAAMPALERSGGAVVVTGSITARTALPTFSSYGPAKHALRAWVQSLRIELQAAGSPVTIAAVHPGTINTPLWGHSTLGAVRRVPRSLPWAYSPESVAAALVAVTGTSRDVTLGAEAKAEQLVLSFGGPIARLVLRGVHAFYSSSRGRSDAVGAVREPVGRGIARGTAALVTRPSFTAPLRRLGFPHRRSTKEPTG